MASSINTIDTSGSWLYSCSSLGELQGRWKLNPEEISLINDKQFAETVDTADLEQFLIDSLLTIKQRPDDRAKQEIRTVLCQFLSYQDSTAALEEKDWQMGLQLFVIDYDLPGNNLMLTSIALHQNQPFNNQQASRLVKNFVASGGSCCGL